MKNPLSSVVRRTFQVRHILPSLCRVLTVVFVFTNVLYAYKPQTSLWDQRQNKQPLQLASSKANIHVGALPHLQKNLLSSPNIQSTTQTLADASEKTTSRYGVPLPMEFLSHMRVRKFHQSPTHKHTVVLIEDVHLNAEAQQHISRALKILGSTPGTNPILVGLEGANGAFLYEQFKDMPYPHMAKEVVNDFFARGEMGGAAHAGLSFYPREGAKGLSFWGVDDPQQYQRNVGAYIDTKQLKKDTQSKLEGIQSDLAADKKIDFHLQLQNFDDMVSSFQRGDMSLATYVKNMSAYEDLIPLTIETFLQAYDLEETLELSVIDRQRRSVLAGLVEQLVPEELDALIQFSLAYQNGQKTFADYYQHIRELCDNVGLDLRQTPEFDQYIQYVLLSDSINPEKLFQQTHQLQESIYKKLIRDERQADLVVRGRQLDLITKLVNFSLTPDEWTRYQQGTALYQDQLTLSPFEEFYRAAEQRDLLLVKNHLDKYRTRKNQESALSVMVAGGFHSQGITAAIEKHGSSYIIASPKLTKVDSGSGIHYLSIFDREKTSVETLFAGKKLFLKYLVLGTNKPLLEGYQNKMNSLVKFTVRKAKQAKLDMELVLAWAAQFAQGPRHSEKNRNASLLRLLFFAGGTAAAILIMVVAASYFDFGSVAQLLSNNSHAVNVKGSEWRAASISWEVSILYVVAGAIRKIYQYLSESETVKADRLKADLIKALVGEEDASEEGLSDVFQQLLAGAKQLANKNPDRYRDYKTDLEQSIGSEDNKLIRVVEVLVAYKKILKSMKVNKLLGSNSKTVLVYMAINDVLIKSVGDMPTNILKEVYHEEVNNLEILNQAFLTAIRNSEGSKVKSRDLIDIKQEVSDSISRIRILPGSDGINERLGEINNAATVTVNKWNTYTTGKNINKRYAAEEINSSFLKFGSAIEQIRAILQLEKPIRNGPAYLEKVLRSLYPMWYASLSVLVGFTLYQVYLVGKGMVAEMSRQAASTTVEEVVVYTAGLPGPIALATMIPLLLHKLWHHYEFPGKNPNWKNQKKDIYNKIFPADVRTNPEIDSYLFGIKMDVRDLWQKDPDTFADLHQDIFAINQDTSYPVSQFIKIFLEYRRLLASKQVEDMLPATSLLKKFRRQLSHAGFSIEGEIPRRIYESVVQAEFEHIEWLRLQLEAALKTPPAGENNAQIARELLDEMQFSMDNLRKMNPNDGVMSVGLRLMGEAVVVLRDNVSDIEVKGALHDISAQIRWLSFSVLGYEFKYKDQELTTRQKVFKIIYPTFFASAAVLMDFFLYQLIPSGKEVALQVGTQAAGSAVEAMPMLTAGPTEAIALTFMTGSVLLQLWEKYHTQGSGDWVKQNQKILNQLFNTSDPRTISRQLNRILREAKVLADLDPQRFSSFRDDLGKSIAKPNNKVAHVIAVFLNYRPVLDLQFVDRKLAGYPQLIQFRNKIRDIKFPILAELSPEIMRELWIEELGHFKWILTQLEKANNMSASQELLRELFLSKDKMQKVLAGKKFGKEFLRIANSLRAVEQDLELIFSPSRTTRNPNSSHLSQANYEARVAIRLLTTKVLGYDFEDRPGRLLTTHQKVFKMLHLSLLIGLFLYGLILGGGELVAEPGRQAVQEAAPILMMGYGFGSLLSLMPELVLRLQPDSTKRMISNVNYKLHKNRAPSKADQDRLFGEIEDQLSSIRLRGEFGDILELILQDYQKAIKSDPDERLLRVIEILLIYRPVFEQIMVDDERQTPLEKIYTALSKVSLPFLRDLETQAINTAVAAELKVVDFLVSGFERLRQDMMSDLDNVDNITQAALIDELELSYARLDALPLSEELKDRLEVILHSGNEIDEALHQYATSESSKDQSNAKILGAIEKIEDVVSYITTVNDLDAKLEQVDLKRINVLRYRLSHVFNVPALILILATIVGFLVKKLPQSAKVALEADPTMQPTMAGASGLVALGLLAITAVAPEVLAMIYAHLKKNDPLSFRKLKDNLDRELYGPGDWLDKKKEVVFAAIRHEAQVLVDSSVEDDDHDLYREFQSDLNSALERQEDREIHVARVLLSYPQLIGRESVGKYFGQEGIENPHIIQAYNRLPNVEMNSNGNWVPAVVTLALAHELQILEFLMSLFSEPKLESLDRGTVSPILGQMEESVDKLKVLEPNIDHYVIADLKFQVMRLRDYFEIGPNGKTTQIERTLSRLEEYLHDLADQANVKPAQVKKGLRLKILEDHLFKAWPVFVVLVLIPTAILLGEALKAAGWVTQTEPTLQPAIAGASGLVALGLLVPEVFRHVRHYQLKKNIEWEETRKKIYLAIFGEPYVDANTAKRMYDSLEVDARKLLDVDAEKYQDFYDEVLEAVNAYEDNADRLVQVLLIFGELIERIENPQETTNGELVAIYRKLKEIKIPERLLNYPKDLARVAAKAELLVLQELAVRLDGAIEALWSPYETKKGQFDDARESIVYFVEQIGLSRKRLKEIKQSTQVIKLANSVLSNKEQLEKLVKMKDRSFLEKIFVDTRKDLDSLQREIKKQLRKINGKPDRKSDNKSKRRDVLPYQSLSKAASVMAVLASVPAAILIGRALKEAGWLVAQAEPTTLHPATAGPTGSVALLFLAPFLGYHALRLAAQLRQAQKSPVVLEDSALESVDPTVLPSAPVLGKQTLAVYRQVQKMTKKAQLVEFLSAGTKTVGIRGYGSFHRERYAGATLEEIKNQPIYWQMLDWAMGIMIRFAKPIKNMLVVNGRPVGDVIMIDVVGDSRTLREKRTLVRETLADAERNTKHQAVLLVYPHSDVALHRAIQTELQGSFARYRVWDTHSLSPEQRYDLKHLTTLPVLDQVSTFKRLSDGWTEGSLRVNASNQALMLQKNRKVRNLNVLLLIGERLYQFGPGALNLIIQAADWAAEMA